MTNSPFREINSGNEALKQLRPYWDKILVAIMIKVGLKEITIDAPDLETLFKQSPLLVVIGRKHLGPHAGFTLCVTQSHAEMIELIARQEGQG